MGIAGGRHRQTQLKGFDELLASRRNENETNKWGPQDSTGSRAHDSIQELGKNAEMEKKIQKPPARIEPATFRLRSERTTTMLRKQLMLAK